MSNKRKLRNVNGGEVLAIDVAVANHVKARRELLNLSQASVAARAGLSRATFSNIERAKGGVTLEQFIKICKALYLSPEQIIIEATIEL